MTDFPQLSSLVTGIESGIAQALGIGGQSFSTTPVPNSALARYTLAVCAPGGAQQPIQTYTFPITPSALVKEYTAMSAMYDVGAPATLSEGPNGQPIGAAGVLRVIDEFGISLPIWTLEGTTGWQRHSADGGTFTGIDSIAALQNLLIYYVEANQAQAASNNPNLYTLQFHDYFTGEFWQVEPIGRQSIVQQSNQPLLFRYQFRWAAVLNLASGTRTQLGGLLGSLLSTPAGQAITSLGSSLTGTISNYTASTIGSLGAPV